jgi:hypothetical protein
MTPRVAATRTANVPHDFPLWAGTITAPCTRCLEPVYLSASSAAMVRAGAEPYCMECIHELEPDALGFFDPRQRAELEEHGVDVPPGILSLRDFR